MLLQATQKRNPHLIECAFDLHRQGKLMPDTYIIDFDSVMLNATNLKKEADKYGIDLFFISKQIGRNPLICKELINIGYKGAVAVDFREAMTLKNNKIPLAHVGHLVQIPKSLLSQIICEKPYMITVYSIEKAIEINEVCKELGIIQNISLRVIDFNDVLYPAQYGGFYFNELCESIPKLLALSNVNIIGLTSFPCFLYDEKDNIIKETNNVKTIKKAKEFIESNFNISIKEMNMPSATSISSMKKIAENGGTQAEPGHGLTGTTPFDAYNDEGEIPSMVYLSEISHNLNSESYCYGGGHYRRSKMKKALVGSTMNQSREIDVRLPDLESIDYYLTLCEPCTVSDAVIMAFRSQIFVTRSNVAIVSGIHDGNVKIKGIFDAQGNKIDSY